MQVKLVKGMTKVDDCRTSELDLQKDLQRWMVHEELLSSKKALELISLDFVVLRISLTLVASNWRMK